MIVAVADEGVGAAGCRQRGESTWQQSYIADLLRRDGEDVDSLGCRVTAFRLPDEVAYEDVRRRLADLMAREQVLQITRLEDRPGGHVLFTPGVEVPLQRVKVDAPAGVDAVIEEMSDEEIPRRDTGSPLWKATVVEHPDEAGRPARSLCAAFDFHISDGASLRLFREAVLTGDCRDRGPQHGEYRQWAEWQRREYPMDRIDPSAPAGQFWRRYLDGTDPDHPTVFPFSAPPHTPLSGNMHWIRRELPVTVPALRNAAGTRRSSPFLLLLAGFVATVGGVAGVDDTVVRVNTNGRPSGYLRTLGAFADILPFRARHHALGDPQHALRAVTDGWKGVPEHCTTPWEYIVRLCGDPAPATRVPGHPKMMFNFMPWPVDRRHFRPGSGQHEGRLGTFQFMLNVADDDGGVLLTCQFDPERLAAPGVVAFLDTLGQNLTRLTA
jgi:hypothetical protein